MSAKTKTSKAVTEMIESMDPDDLRYLIAEFASTPPACRKTSDFPDPGPELSAGQDSVTELEDLLTIERIIPVGGNNLLPVHFLEEGAVRQKAVCRVVVPGQWMGTGFMVSPSLMLTNNHVLPSVAIAKKAQAEFNYQVTYSGAAMAQDTYTLDPDAVFRTNAALDYTLVKVKPKCRWLVRLSAAGNGEGEGEMWEELPYDLSSAEDALRPIDPRFPRLPFPPFRICTYAGRKWGFLKMRKTIPYAKDVHVNIVQHPRGRRKEVALQDNQISKIFTSVVHYTTDTEPGSSGSCVFDNAWDLLAIHHAAGEQVDGVWVSNEGIRIDKIAADLIAHFAGLTGGPAILTDLGIA